MAQQTPLYIIASPHPRVGKTLLARLLIEYLRARRPATRRLRPQSARAVAGRPFSPPGLDRGHRRHTRPDGTVRPADRRRLDGEGDRSGLRPVRAILRGDGRDRLRERSAAACDRADRAVRHRPCAGDRRSLCRAAGPLAEDDVRSRAQRSGIGHLRQGRLSAVAPRLRHDPHSAACRRSCAASSTGRVFRSAPT